MEIPTAYALLSAVISFFIGWFVASKSHRDTIFQNKLSAYKEILAVAAKIQTFYRPLLNEGDNLNSYIDLRRELFESIYKNFLFLSDEVISNASSYANKSMEEKNSDYFVKMVHSMSKELKIEFATSINEKAMYLPLEHLAKLKDTKK